VKLSNKLISIQYKKPVKLSVENSTMKERFRVFDGRIEKYRHGEVLIGMLRIIVLNLLLGDILKRSYSP
jgi:hypothetical protein